MFLYLEGRIRKVDIMFIVETFVNGSDKPSQEKMFWEYNDAQEYLVLAIKKEQDYHVQKFKEPYPDPRIAFNERGMSVKFRGYPTNLEIKVTEKEI